MDTATQTVGTNNSIHDFNQSQRDKVINVFDGATQITSINQLQIDPPSGGNTAIHAGLDAVTLVGFTGKLTAHDFQFA
jgi:hypothetical protein